MVFNHDSEAMESNAPPSLPFERRDSYKPHDPGTHLKLQQLRCVQSDAFDSSVIDPLCSLCKEVLLGEPLLDGNDNDTEYRIPLYALPCGHLRCCSCALRWLDTAGIFHRICQVCDSQKLNIEPDLNNVLDTITTRVEPDLSWIPGFPEKKPSKSSTPSQYSPIRLPTIEEVNASHQASTSEEFDINALTLQTPAKKRRRLDFSTRRLSGAEPMDLPDLDKHPWRPFAGREEDAPDTFNEFIPEEGSVDDNDDAAKPLFDSGSPESQAVMKEREDRLARWARGAKTTPDDSESRESGPTFQEFLEEEKRLGKKPRYSC